MKRLLLKIFFYLYRNEHYKPLSPDEVESLLIKLANTPGFENLPRYLGQCADNARNRYLYSGDEIFKGTILGFTTLRDQILKAKVQPIKKLTTEEELRRMEKRSY